VLAPLGMLLLWDVLIVLGLERYSASPYALGLTRPEPAALLALAVRIEL
jgi:hypothetical protein